MGSVLLQWEREGKKQGVKDREIFESFLFFFFSVSACSCFQLHLPDPNPCFKKGPHHPSAAQTYRGDRGIAGGFARCSARSSPDVASCSSRAIQGRQLMQPCSAGLQCSAEGAGNATVTNDLLIM